MTAEVIAEQDNRNNERMPEHDLIKKGSALFEYARKSLFKLEEARSASINSFLGDDSYSHRDDRSRQFLFIKGDCEYDVSLTIDPFVRSLTIDKNRGDKTTKHMSIELHYRDYRIDDNPSRANIYYRSTSNRTCESVNTKQSVLGVRKFIEKELRK